MLIKTYILLWVLSLPNEKKVESYCNSSSLICPDIVTAQAVIETGHFKSYNCINRNNLFGMRHKSQISKDNPMGYFSYNNWKESVDHYKRNISVRHRIGETYFNFLKRIGYAEDTSYIRKLKSILVE